MYGERPNATIFMQVSVLDTDDTRKAGRRGDKSTKANNILPRVLVIDRDSATQYKIRLGLKDLCKTSAAYTGDLALHYLESQSNALIITAMDLPNGYTGQGLLHAIRAMEGYENIPVIGMATRGRSEDRADVLRQGFDAYFLKPFDLPAFRETVQRLLRVGSTPLMNRMEGKE